MLVKFQAVGAILSRFYLLDFRVGRSNVGLFTLFPKNILTVVLPSQIVNGCQYLNSFLINL